MLERLGSLFALSPGRPELGRGLRMAASMFLPIGIGELVGEPTIGLFVGIGAFLAASCDPAGPYPARAFSMTCVAIGASIAAAAGSLAGNVAWLAVALILLVVAACGFAAVLEARATAGAFIVAIAFVVGVALPAGLCGAGRLLLELAGGGAFAIVLSIARWPLDPEQPVRTAVADGYRAGAGFVRAALGGEGSVLPARTRAYAALRVAKDAAVSSWLPGRERLLPSEQLPHVVRLGRVLDGVLDATRDPERETVSEPIARALEDTASSIERDAAQACPPSKRPTAATPALARLLEDVLDASHGRSSTTPPPPARAAFAVRLRSSLTVESTAFRHAVRLGVAASIGYLLSSLVDREHGVWMTTAAMIVLAPSFGGTFNRAIQRVGGTVIGAAAAGAVAASTTDRSVLLVVAGLFTVAAMSTLNLGYGLFTVLITPLAVLLTAAADPGAWEAADVRVLDTAIGGAIAVVAGFLVLPSWERNLIPDQLAGTLRALSDYLRAVLDRAAPDAIHTARSKAELETANAQAAVARLGAEPSWARRGLDAAELLAGESAVLLDASAALARRLGRSNTSPARSTDVVSALDAIAGCVAARQPPPPAGTGSQTKALASITASIGRLRAGAVAFAAA